MPLLKQPSASKSKSGIRITSNKVFDKVRNYKAKGFKDSEPVYGPIDAFNRSVLKNAHEGAGSANKTNPGKV